jgi:hypothetical protein
LLSFFSVRLLDMIFLPEAKTNLCEHRACCATLVLQTGCVKTRARELAGRSPRGLSRSSPLQLLVSVRFKVG